MSYFKFIHQNPRTLFGVIYYVNNEAKTHPDLMYGFGVDPDSAFEEMATVKQLWNQTDGRQYKHFMFSFDSDIKLSKNDLMDVGCKIGAYYANDYQILMVMHSNTNNTHIHYILNTVNMFTGKKFSITKRDIYNYKLYINQILKSHNLSLIELYDDNEPNDIDVGLLNHASE